MSKNYNSYESPFCTRYASPEMQFIFSADKKFTTWRRLWVALARAEMKLGLPVTQEQVSELEAHIDDINYDVAEKREKEVRHDVMSHVYAYGQQCPKAAGIIHLGATSCYVGDNTDIIIMRDALLLVKKKLLNVIANLAKFAEEYKAMPCLAYTHLQPAQPTTVGKRATLWMNELLMDLEEVEYRIDNLKLLGQKGTTGTQASFVELFKGDSSKIKELEKMIAEEMGFSMSVPVSGQTYSRKIDSQVLATLSGIAQSCSKFSNDLRLLQNFEEMAEPFEKNQIGSSAMPYKRNPMRSERITSLARYDRFAESRVHGGNAVVRENARRQREQARFRSRGIPRGGRYPEYYDERYRRYSCVPRDDKASSYGKAAVYGDGEYNDESGGERRKPSGASRGASSAFSRGSGSCKRGRRERSARAYRK